MRKASGQIQPPSPMSTTVSAKPSGKGLVMLPQARKAPVNNLSKVRAGVLKGNNTPAAPRGVMQNAASEGSFLGALIYSGAWGDTPNYTIMSLPLAGGDPTEVAPYDGTSFGWYADGKYYCYIVQSFWGYYLGTTVDIYDATTWEKLSTVEPSVPQMVYPDMKQNPADGLVYGSASDTQNIMWGTIDLISFQFTPIANVDWVAYGLIIKDGKGYGIDATGQLLEITLETGATLVKGNTGAVSKYLTSAYYDAAGDHMYYAPNTDEASTLCRIDLATAQSTTVYTYPNGEEFTGFFSPRVLAAGTPDVVTGLAITSTGASLDYTVTFTAPANDAQGSPLTGELSYKVTSAGQTFTGTVAPGATASVNATAPRSMMVGARVTVSNSAGESYGVSAQAFVGTDELGPVSGVTLTDNNAGTFTLSWKAPQTINGGYFNPDDLHYVVTDVNGTEIANNLKVTTLEIPYTDPEDLTMYRYGVSAVYMGEVSPAVMSNHINKGSVETPFKCAFDSDTDILQFTLIDSNEDGQCWEYNTANGGCARMRYNSDLAMDDWLMMPGLRLLTGKAYRVSLDAASYGSTYPERFEVKVGNACDPSAMTTTVIDVSEIADKNPTQFTGTFTVPADGIYYVGIHGISAPDMFYLYVDNVAVSGPIDSGAPGKPTDVSATAGEGGALTATVTFTAPTTTIGGDPVGDMIKATVTRGDDTVIGTVDAPAAGQTYSVTDADAPAGNVTYNVIFTNAKGDSEPVSVTVFVGFSVPSPVTSVVAAETSEGQVTVTWDAVTTDSNGLTLPAGSVTYALYTIDSAGRHLVAEDLTATTHSYTATQPGEQAMIQWAVFARNTAGEGDGQVSELISVGTPYTTPFKESFANQTLSYNWGVASPNPDGVMEPNIAGDESIQGITSQDGDNGYLYFKGQYLEDAASLFSGKIAIPADGATTLTFYTFGIDTAEGNEITASVKCEGQITDLGTTVPLADMDWVRVTHSLNAFAGKTVEITLTCVAKKYAYVMYDNITVATPRSNDLALTAINAPAKVQAGSDIEVTATVENQGANEATGFTVDFYMNGKVFATETPAALASGAKATVTATFTTTPLTADEVELYAVVNFAADEDPANNTSATVKTAVAKSLHPAPQSVGVSVVDGKAVISWAACTNLDNAGETVNEDFESGTTGAHEFEGWTMVDMDGKAVGGIQNANIPGIVPGTTTASFFVFEQAGDFTSATFAAHSGTKYLASLFSYDDSEISDWAISPELSGRAQTIGFWAKSYSGSYPEKMRVHTTTAQSVNPADYTAVADFGTVTVPNAWTHYTVDVPAGTTHFAIESCAAGGFILMIDDVTYDKPGGSLTLQGYNVYTDAEKTNTELVTATTYTTEPLTEGEHTFNVTAVYDKGESAPSESVTVSIGGLTNLGTALNVYSAKGEIVVTGAAGADVTVTAASGIKIAAREGIDATRIKVAPGFYLVTVGQRTVKVAVK